MTPRRSEAFVLRVRAFGEADRVADLLTPELGRVPALARSARRSRRRFGGVLDYFVRVRATVRPGRGELWRLDDVELVRDYGAVARDLDTHAAASHVLEVAWLGSREGAPAQALFDLVDAALSALAAGADPKSLRRVFQARVLWVLGVAGAFDRCPQCGAGLGGGAAVTAGAVVCPACAGPADLPMPAGAVRTLAASVGVPLDKLRSVRVTRAAEEHIGPFLCQALCQTLGRKPRTLD